MIENLETLLNADLLMQLVLALNENKDFSFDQNGLTIESKSTDNSVQLVVRYDSTKNTENLIKQERESFNTFIKDIDDNLFTETCENLGAKLINEIHESINGTDLDKAKNAVARFKQEYRELLVSRINYYTECLDKLNK